MGEGSDQLELERLRVQLEIARLEREKISAEVIQANTNTRSARLGLITTVVALVSSVSAFAISVRTTTSTERIRGAVNGASSVVSDITYNQDILHAYLDSLESARVAPTPPPRPPKAPGSVKDEPTDGPPGGSGGAGSGSGQRPKGLTPVPGVKPPASAPAMKTPPALSSMKPPVRLHPI